MLQTLRQKGLRASCLPAWPGSFRAWSIQVTAPWGSGMTSRPTAQHTLDTHLHLYSQGLSPADTAQPHASTKITSRPLGWGNDRPGVSQRMRVAWAGGQG